MANTTTDTGGYELTDQQKHTATTIKIKVEELIGFLNDLGETGNDLSEAKAVLMDLRDTAASLAEPAAPPTSGGQGKPQ